MNTAREFELLSDRVSTLFAANGHGSHSARWEPVVTLEETPDGLILTVELPGVSSDEIDVRIENHTLTVQGDKKETRAHESAGHYHLRERSYGSFRRVFRLPRTVQADRITAHFENGVLSLRMPKSPEALSRKIEIQGNSSKN